MHVQISILFYCLLILLSAWEEKWGIEIKLRVFLFPLPRTTFQITLVIMTLEGTLSANLVRW